MAPPPTVLSIKTNFLLGQTRLLSQPLEPSRSWRTANDASEEGLSDRAVDDALFRVNHLLQQHSRRVHAPQATRHVAEQIDRLYWNAGERAAETAAASSSQGLALGLVELTKSEAIDSLPPTWESGRDVIAYPMEAKRYAELVGRLQNLSERKKQAEEITVRLGRIRDMLGPFQTEDRDGRVVGVQENLVTRDGEVEKELERMRVLLARVGGRVARLLEQQTDIGVDTTSSHPNESGEKILVGDVELDMSRRVNELVRLLESE